MAMVTGGTRAARFTGITARYLLVCCAAAAMLVPFFWMVSASLMTPQELTDSPPPLVPESPQWDSYTRVLDLVPIVRAYANSILVSGIATLGVVVTSTMCGFALAKYRFRGRREVFLLMLASLMVPQFAIVIPLFWMIKQLGWIDTYPGLIVPFLVSGYGVFLMRQFLLDFPAELLDAARIDGASEARILARIVVPLIGPAIATLAAFTFIMMWNSFLWTLLVVRSDDMQTLPLALNSLRSYGQQARYLNLLMAGTAMGVIPALGLFGFLQRYFARGISLGGVRA